MIDVFNQKWPTSDLEGVSCCPYCGSERSTLIYDSVHDYSFVTAPGEWSYWGCVDCDALYLNPRPTEDSIAGAYADYYTHTKDAIPLFGRLKMRLKYECLSQWLGFNFSPRFGFPGFIGVLLSPLKCFIRIPFDLEFLATNPRGSLIDVGCGSGAMLSLAHQLGWSVAGLEIDPQACRAASRLGLKVIQGDYKKLSDIDKPFDCVMCSHVIEHVHDPIELLNFLTASLKSGGHLILALPNSHSDLRFRFGKFWRGLEAPRHLSIPTLDRVILILVSLGYVDIKQHDLFGETYQQSLRIERAQKERYQKNFLWKFIDIFNQERFVRSSDYIQLIAKKL